MLNIDSQNNDPYFNMAVEEYVLTHLAETDDCFMLWQNRPAIIVGRHQNTWEEINADYVREHDIAVVRRLTGGGAVYHDLGNLNFTFVIRDQGKGFDFPRFGRPVVGALAQLGVQAEMSGRNDILIDGRKFSGNAEYRHQGRLLHHGTLLFSSDLSVLSQALQVKPQKIASKGVKSVRSRVTNISEYLSPSVTLQDFRQALLQAATSEFGNSMHAYTLTREDLSAIQILHDEKYATWLWNHGQTPEFNLRREQRFPFGEVDVRLNIKNGAIAECQIFGDFFTNADVGQLSTLLLGAPLSLTGLQSALRFADVAEFLPGLDNASFINLLLGLTADEAE